MRFVKRRRRYRIENSGEIRLPLVDGFCGAKMSLLCGTQLYPVSLSTLCAKHLLNLILASSVVSGYSSPTECILDVDLLLPVVSLHGTICLFYLPQEPKSYTTGAIYNGGDKISCNFVFHVH